jgi:hypothetical protein
MWVTVGEDVGIVSFTGADFPDNESYESEHLQMWYMQSFQLSHKGFMIMNMLSIRVGSHFILRGILLSLSGDAIRVALEDCGDVAEYRRVGSGWVAETGESVEIELLTKPESKPFSLPLTPATERSSAYYCVV